MFKVVDQPWQGTYTRKARQFPVTPVESEYLKDRYKVGLPEMYMLNVRAAFPVREGWHMIASFPVVVDLRDSESVQLGQIDGSSAELVTFKQRFTGNGRLSTNAFHTWFVHLPSSPVNLLVEYISTRKNASSLNLVPLIGVRLTRAEKEKNIQRFFLSAGEQEIVFAVFSPGVPWPVDSLKISIIFP